MNSGGCFPQVVFVDRGNPVLAAVLGVAFEDGLVRARLLRTRPAREVGEAWQALELRASSRDLWGRHAGKHRGRIWIAVAEGWLAIRMIPGDDERMARGVLRQIVDCVGKPRARLESRLIEIDARYRVESIEPQELPRSGFAELSLESQLEALLTLRLRIIEIVGLDDLDEDTTLLEALRERAAVSGSPELREQLRWACAFELAVGRYLGAEGQRAYDAKTAASRLARMHEAFDAACKAFSEFAEIAAEGRAHAALEVRLCFVDG